MEQTQSTSGMMWYNYNPVDGLMTPASAPVQVELGNVEIARQINQQVQLQYGSLQAVPAQPQHIIVAQYPAPQPEEPPSDPVTPEPPVTPKPPKPRVRTSNGERVPCPECGKTFSCNANLRDHLRLHTGERPFVCAECGMSFAQRSNWRLHKRVHTGERPYMCGICGKTFSRSSHLPGHMRVHTGERPYFCEMCEQSFASPQALKNHARTHTGEKPFVCEYCQTAFTHSSSLSSHKKRCNGEKRKRGRPLGSGHKGCRKKPVRPRGRPKKKSRYPKRSKRKPTAKEASHDRNEMMMVVKAEVHAENTAEEREENIVAVEPKQEIEEEVTPVFIDANGMEAEHPDIHCDALQMNSQIHNQESLSIVSEQIPIENHIIHQNMVIPEEVGSAVSTAEGLDDTSDLHQEAAVAMAALHEGARELAQHQVSQEFYAERDMSSTLWFPKQKH